MKSKYIIQWTTRGNKNPVKLVVNATRRQATRIFDTMAYAFANDGGFDSLEIFIESSRVASLTRVNGARFLGVGNG